jgi:hypothetical protein
VSYTLRGRLETRLAVALVPVLAAAVLAAVLREWWPLELAALMVAVGVGLDLVAYHRLLPYQPGWVALPLGLLELAFVIGFARWLGVAAPLEAALAFYLGAWLVAQALGHAAFPLLRLSYGEDGGELGRLGAVTAAACLAALAFAGGVAWGTRPPTVHLAAGVHRGPLVLDEAQTVVGRPGAVVTGGIVITADDVTVRNVTVLDGEHGITVDGAERVLLERVTVAGSELDGINVRRSSVTIRDCVVSRLRSSYAQGIDVSFGFDLAPTVIERCTVIGGQEGIVSHFAHVDLRQNRVVGTTMRGITVTEMSMGVVEGNSVAEALGIGIFCGDYSVCDIDRNAIVGTRADRASGDKTRLGHPIVSHFGATARLGRNELSQNAGGVAAFIDGKIETRGRG